jgi:hypothetical protein
MQMTNLRAQLSKLLVLLLVPFVLMLALVSDILGLELTEK